MKNSILAIINKELYRFFRDPRMVFTTLLLPGLLIYILYSFMGSAMGNMFTADENYKYRIAVVDQSDAQSFRTLISSQSQLECTLEEITVDQKEAYQTKITNKEIDLLMVFPQEFDQLIVQQIRPTPVPNVEIYYNSTSNESGQVFDLANTLLESLRINNFDVNRDITKADLAPPDEAFGQLLSSMLPMLILLFVFSGCMAVATESIAGEKERGTIATLLVTPTKRSDVAIGKIISLGVIALCSGASSFLGLYLSLPKLIGFSSGEADTFTIMYSVQDYIFLALTVLATALLLVSLISIISSFAKTVKEATTTVTPFMIVVAVVGISAMFGSGAKTEIVYYLIPLYNSVQAMVGIFAGDFVVLNVLTTVVSNLVYTMVAVFVLAKLFNSEKVMFAK